MAIIYQLGLDPDRFRYLDTVHLLPTDRFPFDGSSLAKTWERPELYMESPRKKTPDIWCILPLMFHAFALNERALKILMPALQEGVELLPTINDVGNITVVNILDVTDYLDPQKAVVQHGAIYEYAFLLEKIKTQLFRLPRHLGIYVASGLVPPERDFKTLAEAAGLKGATFFERWNSETVEREPQQPKPESVEPIVLLDAAREEETGRTDKQTSQPQLERETAPDGGGGDKGNPVNAEPTDARLEVLEPWLERFRRTAQLLITEEGDGEITGSKLSGTPYLPDGKWPVCGSCDEPMQLFIQLSLKDFGPDYAHTRSGLLQLFFCANEETECYTEQYGDPFNDCQCVRIVEIGTAKPKRVKKSGAEAFAAKRIVAVTRANDYPTFQELKELGLTETRLDDGKMLLKCAAVGFEAKMNFKQYYDFLNRCVTKSKIGGWPAWVQNIEYPKCPKCQHLMDAMILQLDPSEFLPFMLADGGRGQILQCPTHMDVLAFTWASG